MNATLMVLAAILAHPGHHHDPGQYNAYFGEPVEDHAGHHHTAFRSFPVDPALYSEPIAALINDGIVEEHGVEEFAAIVLSHEVRQDIGIYTIIGAKMGILAREMFDAPSGTVEVEVHTIEGTRFAWAKDGLQAALGSTYGQNLITLKPAESPVLEVAFMYGGERTTIKLKPAYRELLIHIVDDAVAAHGFMTEAYFAAIRDASYKIWADWNRMSIFEVSSMETVAPQAQAASPSR